MTQKLDYITDMINKILLKIPKIGSLMSKVYLRFYLWFNFMLVGGSGFLLQWLLYELLLRPLMVNLFLGTFFGMLFTVFLVFMWNYLWNRHWSLSIESQLYSMTRGELEVLKVKIDSLTVEAET